jgi:hypothetical protein
MFEPKRLSTSLSAYCCEMSHFWSFTGISQQRTSEVTMGRPLHRTKRISGLRMSNTSFNLFMVYLTTLSVTQVISVE